MWIAITSSKKPFAASIKCQIGNRHSISFWHDTWVVDRLQLSNSFNYTAVPETIKPRSETTWKGPLFRPFGARFSRGTFTSRFSLLHVLYQLFIPEGGNDNRVRTPSRDGNFSVSSFFSTLLTHAASDTHWDHLWKTKAPQRVLAFRWLALRGRILIWTTFIGRKCSLHAQCVFPTRNRLIIYCLIALSHISSGICSFAILTAAGSSLRPSMTYLQLGCALLAPQKERLCGIYLSWQSFGLFVRIETRDALKAKPPPQKTSSSE